MIKRKRLSKTHRLVTLDKDKSRCCKADIRQRRVYPFPLCCTDCNKNILYEDQIIFKRKG